MMYELTRDCSRVSSRRTRSFPGSALVAVVADLFLVFSSVSWGRALARLRVARRRRVVGERRSSQIRNGRSAQMGRSGQLRRTETRPFTPKSFFLVETASGRYRVRGSVPVTERSARIRERSASICVPPDTELSRRTATSQGAPHRREAILKRSRATVGRWRASRP